jgi:hypothetical protein
VFNAFNKCPWKRDKQAHHMQKEMCLMPSGNALGREISRHITCRRKGV